MRSLHDAVWKKKGKHAELWLNNQVILSLEFSGCRAKVSFGNRKLEIKKEGIWHPKVVVREYERVVAVQKPVGFWGARYEISIGQHKFTGRTKNGWLYNLKYMNEKGEEVIDYSLKTFKWKPVINCIINEKGLNEEDCLLLLALGYYTVRNVMQEAGAMAVIGAAG